jgi:hypothetical protein
MKRVVVLAVIAIVGAAMVGVIAGQTIGRPLSRTVELVVRPSGAPASLPDQAFAPVIRIDRSGLAVVLGDTAYARATAVDGARLARFFATIDDRSRAWRDHYSAYVGHVMEPTLLRILGDRPRNIVIDEGLLNPFIDDDLRQVLYDLVDLTRSATEPYQPPAIEIHAIPAQPDETTDWEITTFPPLFPEVIPGRALRLTGTALSAAIDTYKPLAYFVYPFNVRVVDLNGQRYWVWWRPVFTP